ncbi:transglycosylase family protein [Agilicoccus flavus]|uniref:transglycosylase family protein n=1 Tax=Agilicoccus flavus TaxID=2775968 RepID=UPI001CF63D3E|nr:transglycosylase family protein [Agilicoccus flavus]
MTTARQTIRRTMLTAGATAALATMGIGGSLSASAHERDASTAGSSSVLAKIRECESGGDYKAQNPVSSASGAYQMINATWRGLDASEGYSRAKHAPKAVQDAAARELLAEQGTSPWNPSKHCWG